MEPWGDGTPPTGNCGAITHLLRRGYQCAFTCFGFVRFSLMCLHTISFQHIVQRSPILFLQSSAELNAKLGLLQHDSNLKNSLSGVGVLSGTGQVGQEGRVCNLECKGGQGNAIHTHMYALTTDLPSSLTHFTDLLTYLLHLLTPLTYLFTSLTYLLHLLTPLISSLH